MTFFSDLNFFIVLAIVIFPISIINYKINSKYLFLLVNLIFIHLLFKNNKIIYISFILFLIYEYILIRLTIFSSELYKHFIFLAVLPLILNKFLFIKDIHFGFIGISYITFKIVEIIIEIRDGLIKEINVADYMSYLLFFPTFISGPIDRYRRFKKDVDNKISKDDYLEFFGTGIDKFLTGAFYKFIIASFFFKYMEIISEKSITIISTIGYSYFYGFYLFFDFAGYSLMAVGVAYLFKIKVADNFNKPFLSTDISDFWNRWHITLSFWFRDFIFKRLTYSWIQKDKFENNLVRAVNAFLINMFIMGIWHGLNWSYILYGIYHGVLLSANEVYQKKSKFYKKYKKNKYYKFVSWLITLNLIMFGFLIFSERFILLGKMIIEKYF